jgi:hypothetical protein
MKKDEEFISTLINNNLTKIAHCMEEILRMVKEDQARTAKRFPEPETDELSKEWRV